MKTFTYTSHPWTTRDGEAFTFVRWDAKTEPTEPRAVVVAVHGLSGAALDFEPLGAHLRDLEMTTLAIDLRGQGSDPKIERRGDLLSLQDWFQDLRTFFAQVRQEYPHTPIYYVGESMGGALLTQFLAQAEPIDQPQGLILFVPVVTLPKKIPWWQEQLVLLILKIRPQQRIDVRLFVSKKGEDTDTLLTRDPAHVVWFKSVSHKIHIFTLRFLKNLGDLVGSGFRHAPQVRVPVLLLYAQHDVFITPQKIEEFFGLIGSADKELAYFPESYHLLLHDLDRVEVLAKVEAWLLPRLA